MVFGHRSARRRGMLVGAAVSSSRSKKAAAAAQPVVAAAPAAVAQPVPATVSADDTIEHLKKLAELRDQGILTEEEFSAKKKQILGL